ncbi:MAG: type II toxin-antitoxin system PemK/MazF family toxin [Desulfosarcina sp.]|nr:type II toxin-antitoxin system PemK/MazF family toxin [Desulfobacterales bacterium]
MIIKKGGIYLAALDPAIGHEISKTRPVLVVSNDKNNAFSGTVTVLPITSKSLEKIYPFEVRIEKGKGNLPKASKIKADQIRTIDQKRLIKTIGALSDDDMVLVEKAVKIHLDLRDRTN